MEASTLHSTQAWCQSAQRYTPLAQELRTHVDTNAAAFYLNRRPQTLRIWAMREDGIVRPIRVYGRLAWPVAEIRRVLGVA